MKELNNLLKKLNYEETLKLVSEMSKDENSISLLIQYISLPKEDLYEDDLGEDDFTKNKVVEAIGKVGGPIIERLIRLYRDSDHNLAAKFYAAYALSEHSFCQSGISNEVHQVLLDARRVLTSG